jgi:hypothetical protein
MTTRLTFDELMERRGDAHERADQKAHERMVKREAKAGQMVGELSSGKCYVFPVGGTYREGPRHELIAFLIRNHYA